MARRKLTRPIYLLGAALVVSALAFAGIALADTINGTSGPDELTGTQVADDISGGGGNDEISALCGNDLVKGGLGSDTVDGNGNVAGSCSATVGDDETVIGGGGRDKVIDTYGPATGHPADSDHVSGGIQGDTLNVNDGDPNDKVDGGPGNDTCYADPGDTVVNCETVNP